jgi:hypothetical protein
MPQDTRRGGKHRNLMLPRFRRSQAQDERPAKRRGGARQGRTRSLFPVRNYRTRGISAPRSVTPPISQQPQQRWIARRIRRILLPIDRRRRGALRRRILRSSTRRSARVARGVGIEIGSGRARVRHPGRIGIRPAHRRRPVLAVVPRRALRTVLTISTILPVLAGRTRGVLPRRAYRSGIGTRGTSLPRNTRWTRRTRAWDDGRSSLTRRPRRARRTGRSYRARHRLAARTRRAGHRLPAQVLHLTGQSIPGDIRRIQIPGQDDESRHHHTQNDRPDHRRGHRQVIAALPLLTHL